ncbi:MAG TPA: PAS domain S-box protein [Chryseosolibacter sp.]
MQVLQVDFESVFEALPGMYLLLNKDSPSFTIASMSAEYSAKVCLPVQQARGKSIFDIQLECEFTWDPSLKESLQTVVATRLPHSYHFTLRQDDHAKTYHVQNSPVQTREGEVTFIIHKVSPVNDWTFSLPEKQTSVSAFAIESILDQAPVAMCICLGENLVIEKANAKMLELWGKTENINGMPILEAIPELIDQPFPALMRKVFDEGREYAGTETKAYLNRTGTIEEFYFNFVYSPIFDESNRVKGITMVASDVTGLVEAKLKLEESEKRYRDLIDHATVATAVYTGADMIIYLANDAMLRLWGKDERVIGRPLSEVGPEFMSASFLSTVQDVYKTNTIYYSREEKVELSDNGTMQTYYFNVTCKPLVDTQGNIYAILNMAIDVTDIVKTKMEIFEAEQRWRLALESAELGTWDYYPDTKVFTCSSRTNVLFGVSPEAEVNFEIMLEAIHPADRERVADTIRRSMHVDGGSTYNIEYSIMGIADKKVRWHRTTGQAFYKENGEAYRLTGTVLDITDRKEIEAALEERVKERTAELVALNQALERSNHELEQYAYVASHDLQEPLRKILVYADMLKNNVVVQHTQGSNVDRLEKIITSAQRMSHLIQDLLTFSKVIGSETTCEPVDLNEVVKRVIEDFELMIKEIDAKVEIGTLPTVRGSIKEINQVFYNLISNALKFRKADRPIAISIQARPLMKEAIASFKGLDHTMPYVDIHIADNGIGFDTRYGKQIFEIFRRLNTRTKFEGTGIGLAICRRIVMKHKGLIYAESNEEEGSIFHVVLPAWTFTKDDVLVSNT